MNRSIFWRLVWKEYRLQRALWIAMAVLTVLAQFAVVAYESCQLQLGMAPLYLIAVALPSLYALGCGATLFAGEHEADTYEFQRSLPVHALSVFVGKIVSRDRRAWPRCGDLRWVGHLAVEDESKRNCRRLGAEILAIHDLGNVRLLWTRNVPLGRLLFHTDEASLARRRLRCNDGVRHCPSSGCSLACICRRRALCRGPALARKRCGTRPAFRRHLACRAMVPRATTTERQSKPTGYRLDRSHSPRRRFPSVSVGQAARRRSSGSSGSTGDSPPGQPQPFSAECAFP